MTILDKENLLGQAFENAPCGMMLVDEEGLILSANHSLEAMFGYEAGSLSGARGETLFSEQSRLHFRNQCKAACNQRETPPGAETFFGWHKAKAEFSIEISMTPFSHHASRILLLTAHDRTDQLKADSIINHAMEELRRSNGELQQFAYVASHDLQTPLRHITSFIELLNKKLSLDADAEAKRWINFIIDATINMRTLIDDLLAYSRVRTSDKPFEPVDMASLWSIVESAARREQPGCSLTSTALPVVMGFPNPLLQVLQNLVQNALKFSRPNVASTIDFSCRDEGTHFLFEVRDNGIGIAPEHYERVFLLFQKLHSKEKYPGTGIGLAICKKVVEIHGGRIWIESKVGIGSSFFFTLKKDPGL